MKYIIDVPNGTKWIEAYYAVDHFQYQGKSIIVDSLTPYTEPDRKAIEDEVWEFIRICLVMDGFDFVDAFDSCSYINLLKYSYQEAKAKYEAWLKQKDEIHVGDEIYSDGDYENAIVMEIHGDESVSVYTKNGCI